MALIDRPVRNKSNVLFRELKPVLALEDVNRALHDAWSEWTASSPEEAKLRHDELLREFPDEHAPEAYWTEASSESFVDFFAWGHDHDFGHGIARSGAMGERHLEIVGLCLEYGLLPKNMAKKKVLDVGCWSGGDLLLLAGLGAEVIAIEEHAKSAASAKALCEILDVKTKIVTESLYSDRIDWQGSFDIVYASGVVYHITDPLLFCRIAFAYLRPGGRIVLETKGSVGEGSFCSYAGTQEFGWNWFAPTPQALGRWLVDAGFRAEDVLIHQRENGRLVAGAVKHAETVLPERAGFSRPGSWLEGAV